MGCITPELLRQARAVSLAYRLVQRETARLGSLLGANRATLPQLAAQEVVERAHRTRRVELTMLAWDLALDRWRAQPGEPTGELLVVHALTLLGAIAELVGAPPAEVQKEISTLSVWREEGARPADKPMLH